MTPRPPRWAPHFRPAAPPLRQVAETALELPEGSPLLAWAWLQPELAGWMRRVYAERRFVELRADGVLRASALRVVGREIGRSARTVDRWVSGVAPHEPGEVVDDQGEAHQRLGGVLGRPVTARPQAA